MVRWLERSRFTSANERNEAVKLLLAQLLEERASNGPSVGIALDGQARQVLEGLVHPLRKEPPQASQAAEAALALAAFSLAEGRVLVLDDPSAGDLEGGRLKGDRAVSDHLCRALLLPRDIPATQGPLQSSSFRGGYLSEQVRDDGIRRYVAWQSAGKRTIGELVEMAKALADALLDQASSMPPLPGIVAARCTFLAYRQARERLLAAGSGGAFEQYLLAGLMAQEQSRSQGLRVQTKSVTANDKASGAAGDIEIRHFHKLVGAVEVTAAGWDEKLPQLGAAAGAGLNEVTIAARGAAGVSSEEMAALLAPEAARLGLDVAVLDLEALTDVLASRITAFDRAEAFAYVHRCLTVCHRREPELAHRLTKVLADAGLTG